MLNRLHAGWPWCLLVLVAAGCAEQDQITQYKAPKEKQVVAAKPSRQPAGSAAAWFLKLTGPAAEVEKQYLTFATFMSQFRLNDRGEPEWDLPKGWSEVDAKDLDPQVARARHATLRIDGTTPPLDITITTLPTEDPTSESYIQANFNRWRTQLELPPLSGDDWIAKARDKKELSLFGTQDGFIAFANLKGTTKDGETRTFAAIVPYVPGGMTRDEPADRPERKLPSAPSAPPASAGLKYDVPEGWTATTKPLASVAFTKADGDKSVELTVIRLGGGGAFAANVNRWRGQVGLPSVDEKEIESETIDVGGAPSKFVDLRGDSKALLAVIVPQDGVQWFVKMMGDKDLTVSQRDAFLKFARSLRFE